MAEGFHGSAGCAAVHARDRTAALATGSLTIRSGYQAAFVERWGRTFLGVGDKPPGVVLDPCNLVSRY